MPFGVFVVGYGSVIAPPSGAVASGGRMSPHPAASPRECALLDEYLQDHPTLRPPATIEPLRRRSGKLATLQTIRDRVRLFGLTNFTDFDRV